MFCFVLQRTPTNENNSGTEWQGIQQLLHFLFICCVKWSIRYIEGQIFLTIKEFDWKMRLCDEFLIPSITCLRTLRNISNTEVRVWPHLQTPRRDLKIRRAAEYSWRTLKWLEMCSNAVFSRFDISSRSIFKKLKRKCRNLIVKIYAD